MAIPDVLESAHLLVGRSLEKGGFGIDATVGNGHDTLFLAGQVGTAGRVIGFDVQKDALDATRYRLDAEDVEADVRLVQDSHENMGSYLAQEGQERVDAVMFNLGYLPGSDHAIKTRPDSTISALESATQLIRPGGIITIVAYTGHEGGRRETEAVESWITELPEDIFLCVSNRFVNQQNDPPRLFAVERRREGV